VESYAHSSSRLGSDTKADLKIVLSRAFDAGRRDGADGFYISGKPTLSGNIPMVMSFVVASGKPSVGRYPIWGRAGLLISYSADPFDSMRHAGIYAAVNTVRLRARHRIRPLDAAR